MFEDIISNDPYHNPGASEELANAMFDFQNYTIEVCFNDKIVKIVGDYPVFDLCDDFYEVNQRLGNDSPFTEINRSNGNSKLKSGWVFDIPIN